MDPSNKNSRKADTSFAKEDKDGSSGNFPSEYKPPTAYSSSVSRSNNGYAKPTKFDSAKNSSGFVNNKLKLVAITLLASLALGFAGGWIGANSYLNGGLAGKNDASDSEQQKVVTSEAKLINNIAKNVSPSVVSINVTSQSETFDDGGFFGFNGSHEQRSAGTGIIISSSGLILTNRHVVPDGTSKISVTLSDGTSLDNVEVAGKTTSNDSLDIAFLKIEDTEGHALTPAKIGKSSKIQIGDGVVAIGNALGQFQNTITSGIISGYGRSVQASEQGNGQNAESLDNLFQTDAAINEGNSGGPLVNMRGEVIGVNTAIAGNAQNIGFAIPIDEVSGLISQVVKTGKFERPFLGVRYVSLTPDYAKQLKLKADRGAYLAPAESGNSSVVPGSPAAKAGLKEKDVITKIDGVSVDESNSLASLVGKHRVGETIKLTVLRGNKTLDMSAKLAAMPKN